MVMLVGEAFSLFLKEFVNLDPEVTQKARDSRDNLLLNINEFDQNDFFKLHEPYNVHFGSFSRKTKCKILDDIDLMIGISGNGAFYYSNSLWNNISIVASTTDEAQKSCVDPDGLLNSAKVINKFKEKLKNIPEYSHSDIKKNNEALVLNLRSKEWSFDIVPCFYTTTESDGREYYLIPNGSGKWKKADPTIDRKNIQEINKRLDGRVLELIRLIKRWNKTKNYNIQSYLLEVLILDYCKTKWELSSWIDYRFRDALLYLSMNIISDVYDPKNIQGNINLLSADARVSLHHKINADYQKASQAIQLEVDSKDNEKSINMWRDIFGNDFPKYG